MLSHAIRHELDQLAGMIQTLLGDDKIAACVPLWALVSAYIAIDISGRWPTDADFSEIAAHAAKSATRLDISEPEIHQYLTRVTVGIQRPDEVLPGQKIATIPRTTADLLSKFSPRDKEWWEYLDQIWNAAEAA